MHQFSDRNLLSLLQCLTELPPMQVADVMTASATLVASWFACEKVDAFLIDEERMVLAAAGTSATPLGRLQKELGLDVLPLANGGRIVEVYRTGHSFSTGRADLDEHELRGIVEQLGARSEINVGLDVAGSRRGVLAIVSQQADRFGDDDVHALEIIARWVGALAHRAELVQQLRIEEGARARTTAAEQIVTVLAHDIRNHLNPLAGRLRLLQLNLERGQRIDPAAVAPALAAVTRMTRLTSAWLDLSRLDQGLFELELAPLDLCKVLRETAASLGSPGADIEVNAPPELVLFGDVERLRQAFENVVANGVRHSPPGRPLRIVVQDADSERLVRISVSDEGPGISPELLPHLFERFVSARPSRGIGLGLYLAERITAAHGGSLRVTSRVGAGAQFHFELPRDGPPPMKQQPERAR